MFKKLVPGSDAPYVSYIFTAMVGIGMNMYFLYSPTYLGEIKAISSFLSVSIAISCLLSYLIFRRKYSSVARSFVNPLGDFAGIYGALTFCFSPLGNIMYNPTVNKMYLVGIAAYWLACAIFFVVYLVRHQKFSEEEKKVMFKAYLINANRKKRLNMLRNNKVGSAISASQSGNNLQSSEGRERANSQTSTVVAKSSVSKPRSSIEIRAAEEVGLPIENKSKVEKYLTEIKDFLQENISFGASYFGGVLVGIAI